MSRSFGFEETSFGSKEQDPMIISGLLAAFGDLAADLGGGTISSINMFNHRITISIRHKIAFCIFLDNDDDETQGKFILNTFINAFFAIHGNLIGKENMIQDISIFEDMNDLLDNLPQIKNIYQIIETNPHPLSVTQIQEQYMATFPQAISKIQIWEVLRMLVLSDLIVEIDDQTKGILYRKKGELLKGLGFKIAI